ncbi:MAG TPA: phosphopantothenoylcysteine decarboxylase [Candidatus Baltobacteraceae bacterium]|jgi:phosphopantothenoylcysteine decarboxylase/phosphopantothenate--cysteine ligase|nr:phosphopantothenoylcysteine decarboxylase [Candidatus Baltobacteraceae bacterium]
MKCIVTAGPAYEELDEVRRLTNFSTGALGSELANFLAARGHEVELLRGHYSTCQIEPRAQRTQVFTTAADLRRLLQKLRSRKPAAVFHAAAVSDFAFGKIWSRAPGGALKEIRSPKISTRSGPLLAELVPAPKIISELRAWFPHARLIGWKYELEGNRAQAIARAAQQLADNRTDACVINGRAYGAGFGLLTPSAKCRHLPDKTALFKALEKFLSGTVKSEH